MEKNIFFKIKYLSHAFEVMSKDPKQVFVHCDFNKVLLDYNEQRTANDVLDSLASNS